MRMRTRPRSKKGFIFPPRSDQKTTTLPAKSPCVLPRSSPVARTRKKPALCLFTREIELLAMLVRCRPITVEVRTALAACGHAFGCGTLQRLNAPLAGSTVDHREFDGGKGFPWPARCPRRIRRPVLRR